MTRDTRPGADRTRAKLTLHLGAEGEEHLNRCRQLLADRDPTGQIPHGGLTVRIALRRLLLSLLGERADWTAASDRLRDEYLALLGEEQSAQQLPGLAEEKFTGRRSTNAGRPKKARRLKGGTE